MIKYSENGLRIGDLWHHSTRIKASDEVYDANGFVKKGTMHISWCFWNDPNIEMINFKIYMGNRNVIETQSWEDMIQRLNVTGVVVKDDAGASLVFDMSSSGYGIHRIEVEYIDRDGWFKVNDGGTSIKEFTVEEGRKFYILILDEHGQYTVGFADPFRPIPLVQKRLILDIRKDEYTFEFMSSKQGKVVGAQNSKVFIKYA